MRRALVLLSLLCLLAAARGARRRRRRTGCPRVFEAIEANRLDEALQARRRADPRPSELPPRAPGARRPAARALAAAADLRQRGEDRAAGEDRRPARRGARAPARAAPAARPRTACRAPCCSCTPEQKHVLLVDSRRSRLYVFANDERPAAPDRRLLRHAGQERHGEDARGRPEDAGRRVPRHRQPAAQEAHRLLRRRRLPDQLPERVGQAPGPQRPRHLAARRALRRLQPPAARERRLHRARQPRPGVGRPATCRSA